MSRKNFQVLQGNNNEANELEGRQKMLELNKIRNMFIKDMQVKLRVKNDSKVTPTRIIQGTVIQKNNYLIAVKTNSGVESFGYSDFFTHRAKILVWNISGRVKNENVCS